MEQFLINNIVQPEMNRFIHHLCLLYDKPITTYQSLFTTDLSKLRLLSNFPNLHKENSNLNLIDELSYDTTYDDS